MQIKNTPTSLKVLIASAVVAGSWTAGSWASADSTSEKPALAHAKTADRATALWVYKKKSFNVAGNDFNSGFVDCPRGYHVTGGGIQTSSVDILLNETRPYDNPGGDNKPDNGWQGYVINPTPDEGSFIIYAICHR